MSEYHHQPGPAFTHTPPDRYKHTVGDHPISGHSAGVLLLVVPPIEFPVHQLYPSFDLFLHLICVQTKKVNMILVTLSFYPRHEIILSCPVLINLFMAKTCKSNKEIYYINGRWLFRRLDLNIEHLPKSYLLTYWNI